jgi:hypothetical protein
MRAPKEKYMLSDGKSSDPQQWNVTDLHTMVALYKGPGDSNILKRKEQLLHRYLLTCCCSELEPKQKKDYEPAVIDDMDAPATAKNNNLAPAPANKAALPALLVEENNDIEPAPPVPTTLKPTNPQDH